MTSASWWVFQQQWRSETARSDWLAGCFGVLVRSVAFAKNGGEERDAAMRWEHAFYLVLAMYIVVGSLRRSPSYVRVRNILAAVVRLGALGQGYIYVRPLLHGNSAAAAAAAAASSEAAAAAAGQPWGSNGLTFFVKCILASKTFFLCWASLVLPLPLHWMLAVQPLLLAWLGHSNAALCAAPALQHARARAWMLSASRLLRIATSAGAGAGVEVRPGAECEAVLLFSQMALGCVLPLFLVARQEGRRFRQYAEAHGLPTSRTAARLVPLQRQQRGQQQHGQHEQDQQQRRLPCWAGAYLALDSWASSPEYSTARWATLVAAVCACWIFVSVAYSQPVRV